MFALAQAPYGKVKIPRLVSYIGGGVVILLALAGYFSDQRVSEVLTWVGEVFGLSYALVYGGLVGLALFSWERLSVASVSSKRLHRNDSGQADSHYYMELGSQAAAGIATLSLTFTLLGISLGIGSLADKTIDVGSIQAIIQELTGHFSTAFMTTVVGLPTASILRAMLALRFARMGQNLAVQKNIVGE